MHDATPRLLLKPLHASPAFADDHTHRLIWTREGILHDLIGTAAASVRSAAAAAAVMTTVKTPVTDSTVSSTASSSSTRVAISRVPVVTVVTTVTMTAAAVTAAGTKRRTVAVGVTAAAATAAAAAAAAAVFVIADRFAKLGLGGVHGVARARDLHLARSVVLHTAAAQSLVQSHYSQGRVRSTREGREGLN